MEVEIEDLHLQIDDIAKAKTAVRCPGCRARLRENRAGTAAAFTSTKGPFQPGPFTPGFSAGRAGLPPLSLPLMAEAREGRGARGEVAVQASKAHLPV